MPRFAVAPVLLLVGCLAAGAAHAQIITASPKYLDAPNKLTADEVRTLFSGAHRQEGMDVAGNHWTIKATANGAMTVSAGAYTDTGHGHVDGDRLCVEWDKAWKGTERCFRYAHHGQELASYGPEGGLNSVLTVSH